MHTHRVYPVDPVGVWIHRHDRHDEKDTRLEESKRHDGRSEREATDEGPDTTRPDVPGKPGISCPDTPWDCHICLH